MIADMLSNKKLNPIVNNSKFAVPKNIKLNSTHHFIIKIQNKRELSKLHLIIHQILTLKTL